MNKRIFKYGTGDIIPNGSKFVHSIVEEKEYMGTIVRLVWHYYLVEVED